MSGFENQWDWTPETLKISRASLPEGQRATETEAPFFTGQPEVSPSPTPSTKVAVCKVPELFRKRIYRLILGCVPEGQGSKGTFSRNRSAGRYIFFALL